MSRPLNEVRADMLKARRRFLNGDTSAKSEMESLAVEAADIFNEKAREVAKRMGTRPQLTTAARIMRRGEFML